jgi:phosphoribosylformylglycinamidine synthase
MDIDLRAIPRAGELRDDLLLFSESQSRFVATVRPANAPALEAVLHGLPFASIGVVTDGGVLRISGRAGTPLIEAGIQQLKAAWQRPLNW